MMRECLANAAPASSLSAGRTAETWPFRLRAKRMTTRCSVSFFRGKTEGCDLKAQKEKFRRRPESLFGSHGEHGAPPPVHGAEHPAFATAASLSGHEGKIFRRHDLVLSFPGAIKYKGQERNASSGCLSAENRAGRYVYYLNFPSIFHRRAHS